MGDQEAATNEGLGDAENMSDEELAQAASNVLSESEQPEGTEGESFTNINPEELPEELKGVYKNLQADYTRKMQDAAQVRRDAEDQTKQAYDEANQKLQLEMAQVRGEMEAIRNATKPQQAEPDYDEELEPWQRELHETKKQIAEEREARLRLEDQQKIVAANSVFESMKYDKEGNPTMFADYEKEILNVIEADPGLKEAVKTNPQNTLDAIYGRFIRRDLGNIKQKAAESEKARLLDLAKKNAEQATASRTSLGGTATDTAPSDQPPSMRDALEQAWEQHGGQLK